MRGLFNFMYTNNQFHTSQVLATQEAPRVVRKASTCIFVGAIALYISTLIPSHPVAKLSQMAIASSLVYVSCRLDKLEKLLSPYEAIAHQQSTSAYQQWLGHSMKPPAREVAIDPIELAPEPVQFSDIRKALSKPHILVLGETGSGKSTLVKFLVANAVAPSLVLDSHAAPDDWQSMTVIGMGRNYDAIGEEVERLVALMDARYEARGTGQKTFEPFIVILDEFPACVANLGKGFTENIMLLVRESRKVAIRLIVLSQGAEVKALGIEGQGSIRECFAIVALGKFATDKAKSMKDEPIKSAIASAEYPAMLDEFPCQLPKIDGVTLKVLPMPKDYLALLTNSPADTIKPVFDDVDEPSAPVSTSAKPKLSAPLSAILEYAKKQNDFVSARKIQSGIRLFRDASVSEIRNYFQWLADKNYGDVRGDVESLEFLAK